MFPPWLGALLLAAAAGAGPAGGWRLLRSFEDSPEGYLREDGAVPALSEGEAYHGDRALLLEAAFPGRVGLRKRGGVGRLARVEVWVRTEPAPPRDLALVLFLKDKDGLWWQSEARRVGPEAGRRWVPVAFDLYRGTHPVNHGAPFDRRFAGGVRTVGFRFFSRRKWRGRILLDALRGREDEPPALAVRRLRPLREGPVPLYRPFEAEFDLPGNYYNPFDPDEVSVEAHLRLPSGKEVTFPCYFHQDYERLAGAGGRDEYLPVGRGRWRLRFSPLEEGRYEVRIRARCGGEEAEGGPLRFRAVSSGAGLAPVRVSRENPFAFETLSGRPFYPLGHNLRSPTDLRCTQVLGWAPLADRGLAAYERIFQRMAENGENLAEVWMASWWLGIEWTPRWKGYHGLGRYNLEHAWKLDRLLDAASRHGIYLHLVIDNHGKLSSYCDPEWHYSPYNRLQGGFLTTPDEFFTDPRARALHKKKLRYIIARWAAYCNIMGFELVSELDLTGSRHGTYRLPYVLDWHREMAAYFRSLDCFGHLLTTHFSGNFQVIDPKIASDPAVDYVVVDAYRGGPTPFPELLLRSSAFLARFGKPFMITEYGGAWNGTDEAGLRADLHSGLWAAATSRFAGTPLLWWFDFIDRRDLYGEFRALARFLEGEDQRRTRDWKESAAFLREGVACLLFHGEREGRGWVFDVGDMTYLSPGRLRRHEGLSLELPAAGAGALRVEFWDTRRGEVVERRRLEREEGGYRLVLPAFAGDIAFKWRAAEGPATARQAASRERRR